jgi:hypothetical protein
MTEQAHDWRWDEVFKVYRCNRCLVASNKPHGPICPKADPPVSASPEEP